MRELTLEGDFGNETFQIDLENYPKLEKLQLEGSFIMSSKEINCSLKSLKVNMDYQMHLELEKLSKL